MKKLLLSTLVLLFFAGHLMAYPLTTYNDTDLSTIYTSDVATDFSTISYSNNYNSATGMLTLTATTAGYTDITNKNIFILLTVWVNNTQVAYQVLAYDTSGSGPVALPDGTPYSYDVAVSPGDTVVYQFNQVTEDLTPTGTGALNHGMNYTVNI